MPKIFYRRRSCLAFRIDTIAFSYLASSPNVSKNWRNLDAIDEVKTDRTKPYFQIENSSRTQIDRHRIRN